MTTRDASFSELLFSQGHGMPDLVWFKILTRSVFTVILSKFVPESIEGAKSEIRNSFEALFQISPLDVLTGAWKKYELVAKAMEESKRNPNDTILRPLAKHTVKSIHHPYVEVFMDNNSMGKLEFELTAAFDVEGLTLKIQRGEISAIMTGTCQGSIQLSFAGEYLTGVKTERISLPGSIAVKSSKVEMDMDSTQPALHDEKYYRPVNRL